MDPEPLVQQLKKKKRRGSGDENVGCPMGGAY